MIGIEAAAVLRHRLLYVRRIVLYPRRFPSARDSVAISWDFRTRNFDFGEKVYTQLIIVHGLPINDLLCAVAYV